MANDFNETVGSLFKGMNTMMTTKTVVGEPTRIGDTIILPLVDVNFGVAAGAFAKNSSNSAGGGMGGKMSPSAVLVITDGRAKMISVKSGSTVDKLVDMVPEVVDKLAKVLGKGIDAQDEEIKQAIDEISAQESES